MLAEKLDDWTEQWKREGRQQEAAAMLLRFLTKRFGAVDAATRVKVETASLEQLEGWGDRVLDANSLDDVFLSSGD